MLKANAYASKLLLACVLGASSLLMSGCGGGGASGGSPGVTLMSVEVTPTNPSIANGTSQQLTATAKYSDNSVQNVTASATWSSGTPATATVNTGGLVHSVAPGTSVITAAFGAMQGTTTVTVTPAVLVSLAVTPTTPSIAKGTSQQFVATGTFSDNTHQDLTSSATWTSSAPATATISNTTGSNGLAQSVAAGTTTVTASVGSVQSSTTLTVTPATLQSISVTSSSSSAAKGTTLQFTATGIFTDSSTQNLTNSVTWASSDTSVAGVSNTSGSNGLAVAKKAGTTNITATNGTLTGSAPLTVTGALLNFIQVTPSNAKLANGFTLQYTATGIYNDNTTQDITNQVTWVSTNTSHATISNATGSAGLATSVAPGVTTIAAQQGTVSGSTNLTVTAATLSAITVSPPNQTLPKGKTLQYSAVGTFSDSSTQDLTTQVTWSSTAPSVATISSASGSAGLATATASAGSTTIQAINGSITGTATLTASNADIVSIAVTTDTPSVPKGVHALFKATGSYTDGSNQDITQSVTWSSSNTAVATINNASPNQGDATGIGLGTATMTAKLLDSNGTPVTGTATLTVTSAVLQTISVTPANASVPLGTPVQYKAVGTYSDSTTSDITNTVTWGSDSSAVNISNAAGSKGKASTSAKTTTPANISAIDTSDPNNPVSGSTTLTVTDVAVTSITVTPSSPTIGVNASLQFKAQATYSDASTADVTDSVTWSSNNSGGSVGSAPVADVANGGGHSGLAFAKAQGTASITATDPVSLKAGSTVLTVGPAALQSITISPPANAGDPGRVPVGYKAPFTVIGHYADASTQDLTASATWNSLNPAVVTVSNTSGGKGLVTGVTVGTGTITASVNGFSATKTIVVNNATISSIAVSPSTSTASGSGVTKQYAAAGTFSDGEVLDLTAQVTWSSSNTNAATITAAGIATSKQVLLSTSVTISAASGGVTGTATLTVNPF